MGRIHSGVVAVLISLFLTLGLLACGGGGGSGGGGSGEGLLPENNVTVTGIVDDGLENSPIVGAFCWFVDSNYKIRSKTHTVADGKFTLVVPPNIEGTIRCSPPNLPRLSISTYCSTTGMPAGSVMTGEDINPTTTLVGLIVQLEPSVQRNYLKQEYLKAIAEGPDERLGYLNEVYTELFNEAVKKGLDANIFDEIDGEEGNGDSGDAGGGDGDAGDGGATSPIQFATCDYVISDANGNVDLNGQSILYENAIADFF